MQNQETGDLLQRAVLMNQLVQLEPMMLAIDAVRGRLGANATPSNLQEALTG
jgi:hypothetical protein